MASKLGIYNLTLSRLGQRRLVKLTDDNENRRKLDNIYDQTLGDLQSSGPEKGWRFTKKPNVAVDRESTSIAAFANYTSIVSGEVLVTTEGAHNLVDGNDVEINTTTSYDGDHDGITFISPSQFTITDTFVADDATGTVYWISDNYRYRYTNPVESQRVVSVKVGGIEVTDWFEEDGYILTNMESITVYMDYIKLITDTSLFPAYFTKVLVLSLAVELSDNITKSVAKTERLEERLDVAMSKAIGLDEQKQYVEEVSTSWVDAGRN